MTKLRILFGSSFHLPSFHTEIKIVALTRQKLRSSEILDSKWYPLKAVAIIQWMLGLKHIMCTYAVWTHIDRPFSLAAPGSCIWPTRTGSGRHWKWKPVNQWPSFGSVSPPPTVPGSSRYSITAWIQRSPSLWLAWMMCPKIQKVLWALKFKFLHDICITFFQHGLIVFFPPFQWCHF